jgi:hypothetical protein
VLVNVRGLGLKRLSADMPGCRSVTRSRHAPRTGAPVHHAFIGNTAKAHSATRAGAKSPDRTREVRHEIAAAAIYEIIAVSVPIRFHNKRHERTLLKVPSAKQEVLKPMPERYGNILDAVMVVVTATLLIAEAIPGYIEDCRYRKTLTPEELKEHLETNRREMNIW